MVIRVHCVVITDTKPFKTCYTIDAVNMHCCVFSLLKGIWVLSLKVSMSFSSRLARLGLCIIWEMYIMPKESILDVIFIRILGSFQWKYALLLKEQLNFMSK